MTTPTLTEPSTRTVVAQWVTDALEPKNWLLVITLAVGWHAAGWSGVAWGVVAGIFSGVLPILWIKWGERRKLWGDRHVRRRQDRLLVIPGIMVSVGAGITVMVAFDAPRELLALVAAMMAALAVFLLVTTVWKISFHTAVPAGAVAVASLAFGWWALAAVPLVAIIGWSRLVLSAHTFAQVVAGAAAGAGIAAAVFMWLR
ncbi:hypothetical protein OTB20_25155 [Streptomyces sp. H27-H1]|uniref:hypothetical protein n=1 Tax=unclassified Streptomyces TaxID=2593676 RepID=UPI0022700F2F|nr:MULTISPECIES: hypothetical protein [unclassified Streptomyces]MCY0929427.1 hypothetical protein [Streptomyces sp. H27-H1]MCY0938576.1 hypothetical protein [Streptomyces sp. H34-S4]